MDPERFRQAYQKLQSLEERSTYKIRPSSAGLSVPTAEQLAKRVSDLANHTIELTEVVDELFQAIAARPQKP